MIDWIIRELRRLEALLWSIKKAGGAAFYQTIQDDSTPVSPQAAALNFSSSNDPAGAGTFSAIFGIAPDAPDSATAVTLLTPYRPGFFGPGIYNLVGQQSVHADVSSGTPGGIQLHLPGNDTSIATWEGMRVPVKDIAGAAATHTIQVFASSEQTIEDPYTPGTYGASVTLNTNGAGVIWEFDTTTSKWSVMSAVGLV